MEAARAHANDITDARAAPQQLDPLSDELFPAEQARIVTLLVERIDIDRPGLLQLADRVPDRPAADAVALGQAHLSDPLPRLELSGQDSARNILGDLFRQGLRTPVPLAPGAGAMGGR